MINLRVRTEYNFRRAFGSIEKIIARTKHLGHAAAAITDVGTWGHASYFTDCRKAGIKALLGAEIAVVADATLRERQPPNFMGFIARSNAGLRELYELTTLSTDKETRYYYFPRIGYDDVAGLSDDIIVLSGTSPRLDLLKPKGNLFIEKSFMSSPSLLNYAAENGRPTVVTSDNFYPAAVDKMMYEILLNNDRNNQTYPMHLPDPHEFKAHFDYNLEEFNLSNTLASECSVDLPQAELVRFNSDKSLEWICRDAAKRRGIDLNKAEYNDRLNRELQLIKEKDFEDYFYVLWDLINYAKQHMLVGPARGSSCGSLVCYILGITEIDPLPYGLLFERFIDVTRKDLPDVDIDFADDRRDMVFDYLFEKYGQDCVARLGTILRYKAKSAISQVAWATVVPEADVAELKNRIIERSTGDSRARFCIADTFKELDIGKAVIEKHPQMIYAGELEYHASHSGQHAAGIVVTQDPVTHYCSLDRRSGALQVDKYDAEKLNLLKIDALGLRTLSILQDILDQIGQEREWLYRLPVTDQASFDVLNNKRYAGIFQFEGFALQSFCSQMKVESFEDYASITSLARPGPLNSGSATDFVEKRTGRKPVDYLHESCREFTQQTYGTIIYQEQVMQVVRNVGKLSWEDTSALRKAMSKSFGEEYFNQFWERFKKGAKENGVSEKDAKHIWDHVNTMGSWSFNRSHAVAYGLVSYWCCFLKAHHPLEFAVANLRHAKDNDQAVRLLREFDREGVKYVAVDVEKSEINWTVQQGVLIGGLAGIKGCGQKKASEIIKKRKNKTPFLPGELKLLNNPITPWDDVFECKTRYGYMKENPGQFNIVSPILNISEVTAQTEGEFLVFGKLKEKNLRDANETVNLAKRGGRKVTTNNLWLNIMVEDDTGSIICRISRWDYPEIGKPIIEEMVENKDWLLIKGKVSRGFRLIEVEKYRHLTKGGNENRTFNKNDQSTPVAAAEEEPR